MATDRYPAARDWFVLGYALPLARSLPGRLAEVHCPVPLEVARTRYQARAGGMPVTSTRTALTPNCGVSPSGRSAGKCQIALNQETSACEAIWYPTPTTMCLSYAPDLATLATKLNAEGWATI